MSGGRKRLSGSAWRRAAALLAVLLLAGAACRTRLAPLPEPPARAPRADTIRIATLNTWLLPVVSDDLGDRLEQLPPRVASFGPDLLCLQEVWLDDHARALQEAFATRLPHAARSGGGLLTLSRWPIVEESFQRFPTDDLSITEKLAAKGLLVTRIQAPFSEFRVVNTHCALDRSPDQIGRRRQLDVLMAWLQEAHDLPVLLAGDLNFPAVYQGRLTSDWLRLVREADLQDAFAPRRSVDGRWEKRPATRVGWPRNDPSEHHVWSVDTLMARGTQTEVPRLLRASVHLDRHGTAVSDHNLLIAEWRLVRPPEGR